VTTLCLIYLFCDDVVLNLPTAECFYVQEDNGVVEGGAMSHTSSLIKSDIVFECNQIVLQQQVHAQNMYIYIYIYVYIYIYIKRHCV